jgi:hypothetical protein
VRDCRLFVGRGRCVEVGITAPVQVSAGWLYAVEDVGQWAGDAPVRELDGELRVVRGPQSPTGCGQFILFPDEVAMVVDAQVTEDRTVTEDLCGMAATAVDGVVDVLTAGAVRHRALPDNSFGLLDACDLATANGLAPNGMRSWPSGHRCLWLFAGGEPSSIEFVVGTQVATSARDGVEVTDIAGRRMLTFRYDTSCRVWTEHVPVEVEGHSTTGYVESAVIWARGSGADVEKLCTAARETAAKVWPALPAT